MIFAEGVKAGVLDREPKVNCITTEAYPTPTARPAYSVLSCNKLERLLQQSMPSWKLGLAKACNQLIN
jgi:dTDP-4-dehydrorhamnose reductase